MIFGAKKDITRKERIGFYIVVEYKGKTQVYLNGAYVNTVKMPFDDFVSQLRKEIAR